MYYPLKIHTAGNKTVKTLPSRCIHSHWGNNTKRLQNIMLINANATGKENGIKEWTDGKQKSAFKV